MLKQIYTSKPQSLLIGCPRKHLNRTFTIKLKGDINCKVNENFHMLKPGNSLIGCCPKFRGLEQNVGVFRKFSSGFCSKNGFSDYQLIIARGLSSSSSQKVGEGNGKTLPWLAKAKAREVKRSKLPVAEESTRSPWEVSAEKFLKGGSSTTGIKEIYRSKGRQLSYKEKGDNVEDEGVEDLNEPRSDKMKTRFNRFDEVKRGSDRPEYRKSSREENWGRQNGYKDKVDNHEDGGGEDVDEPRWDKIKPRYNRIDEVNRGSDRPEYRRWSKEENWGRNTWKEATESTVPKLVGEGIYGVGPILAALLAERREFYTLYVQEGLDLSGNNRKKKDKKGFEKILRMAEKIALTKKEVSKHDLNMVVDNRPHQGLVLDASPLEMVGVKELEPVSVDEQNGQLWVALDEVTDPQNLGAIIRSSYFFGVSGVVLCAKNSAPLSGVVSKASAGSLELMELRSCKNMMQFLTSSAENGWRVLGGSVSSRAVPLNDIVPGAPTILVLGSEGTGLRPLVERSCTELVRIPGNTPVNLISGGDEEDAESAEGEHGIAAQEFSSFMAVESLNVSVAAGVLLHHLIGSNNHLEESQ